MEHSAFPSDEILAAFIDGRLDEETRKRVVDHVADCDECYGTLEASGAWSREQVPSQVTPVSFSRRRGRSLIGWAVAAAIAGVLLFQPVSVRYHQRRDTAALRDAADGLENRTIDERLSLGLKHKPLPRTYRSGSKTDDTDYSAILAAASQTEADLERDSSVASKHTLGLAYLLAGYPQQAVAALESAIKVQTSAVTVPDAIRRCNDAALLDDLAAAYGKNGAKQLAMDAAARAWQIDPKSPKAAWNRAVAMERLEISTAAKITAWKDYLALDSQSEWAGEARNRISNLNEE